MPSSAVQPYSCESSVSLSDLSLAWGRLYSGFVCGAEDKEVVVRPPALDLLPPLNKDCFGCRAHTVRGGSCNPVSAKIRCALEGWTRTQTPIFRISFRKSLNIHKYLNPKLNKLYA